METGLYKIAVKAKSHFETGIIETGFTVASGNKVNV